MRPRAWARFLSLSSRSFFALKSSRLSPSSAARLLKTLAHPRRRRNQNNFRLRADHKHTMGQTARRQRCDSGEILANFEYFVPDVSRRQSR